MSTERKASLDTIRALAIFAVVQCHCATAYGRDNAFGRVLQLGGHGVDLFFVLSGWLLGCILARELTQTGTIDIRRFWLRRWLRTLPAYYAVLLFTLLQTALQAKEQVRFDYLIFAQNYADMPYFTISWSLCVEEHFYLAVAPALVFLYGRRRGIWIVAVVLAIPIVCREMGWYGTLNETHVRFDQCAVGVLLGCISVMKPALWHSISKLTPVAVAISIGLLLFNIYTRVHPELGIHDLNLTCWTFMCASLILLANSNKFCAEELSFPGARYLAERSYAIYLLHVEAFSVMRVLPEVSFPIFCLLVWLISIASAELLFRFVERPGMMLREKFAISRAFRS